MTTFEREVHKLLRDALSACVVAGKCGDPHRYVRVPWDEWVTTGGPVVVER